MRRRHKLQVSTFPFLAVLLCTMGSLILVLLVMDRKARHAAQARAAQKAAQQADELARAEAESAAERQKKEQEKRLAWEEKKKALHVKLLTEEQMIQLQMKRVRDQLAEALARLRAEKEGGLALQGKARTERDRLAEKQRALAELRAAAVKEGARAVDAHSALARMTEDVLQLEQTLKELKAARQRETQTFSVIPYHGRRGESRRPLYVECTSASVIFHPGHVALDPIVNTVAVRAEVRKRIEQQWARYHNDPTVRRPYLLLLVRPNGMVNYYRLQSILADFKVDFGYEFIDPDWLLDFPEDEEHPRDQPWMTVATTTRPHPPAPIRGNPSLILGVASPHRIATGGGSGGAWGADPARLPGGQGAPPSGNGWRKPWEVTPGMPLRGAGGGIPGIGPSRAAPGVPPQAPSASNGTPTQARGAIDGAPSTNNGIPGVGPGGSRGGPGTGSSPGGGQGGLFPSGPPGIGPPGRGGTTPGLGSGSPSSPGAIASGLPGAGSGGNGLGGGFPGGGPAGGMGGSVPGTLSVGLAPNAALLGLGPPAASVPGGSFGIGGAPGGSSGFGAGSSPGGVPGGGTGFASESGSPGGLAMGGGAPGGSPGVGADLMPPLAVGMNPGGGAGSTLGPPSLPGVATPGGGGSGLANGAPGSGAGVPASPGSGAAGAGAGRSTGGTPGPPALPTPWPEVANATGSGNGNGSRGAGADPGGVPLPGIGSTGGTPVPPGHGPTGTGTPATGQAASGDGSDPSGAPPGSAEQTENDPSPDSRKRRAAPYGMVRGRPARGGSSEKGIDEPFAPVVPPSDDDPPPRPRVLIPYEVHGNRDWSIYLECREDGVVLYPARKWFPLASLTSAPNNPLLLALVQTIKDRQATLSPGETPFRPQIIFLVRAGALRTCHLAYPALEALSVAKKERDVQPDEDVQSIMTER